MGEGRFGKFRLPATLLTEPLSQTSGDHGGGLGVELADLVASVVVLCVREIGTAALSLTPWRVGRARLHGSRPPVEPVHEVVFRREVGPATQIQSDSRCEVDGRADLLALRDQQESLSVPVSAGAGDGIEGQHGLVMWGAEGG